MICNKCNNEVEAGLIFCSYCGNNLTNMLNADNEVKRLNEDLRRSYRTIENMQLELRMAAENLARKKPLSNTVKVLITVLIMICFLLSLLTAYVFINQSESQYANASINDEVIRLEGDIDNYKTKIDDYESQISDYKLQIDNLLPNDVYVKINSIYNADTNGKKISDLLYASTIQYLYFEYTIYTAVDDIAKYKDTELEVRIYGPNGELEMGQQSTDTYTFLETIYSDTGSIGWGSDTAGLYTSGLYVIEIIYNSSVVGSQSVIIQ